MKRRPVAFFLALSLLVSVFPLQAGLAAETRTVTFFWQADGMDYSACDMWIWFPGKDGHGYLFEPCDYGAKVSLEVPADVDRVGFIVRRACSDPGGASWGSAEKDFDGDRYAELTGPVTEVWLKEGDGTQYLSNDGGKTLFQERKMTMAGIVAMNQIQYFLAPAVRIESLDQVHVKSGDAEVQILELSSLNNQVVTGVITLAQDLDLSQSYTVQIDGYDAVTAVPTKVFDTPEFAEQLTYTGDDLGATLTEAGTQFRVWAPTAGRVRVNLFEAGDGGEAYETLDMVRGEKGVWSVTASCGAGTYYTYSVTTALGEQEAVDPYARAAGVNGDRGMVVSLPETDPEGFSADTFCSSVNAYNEAVIWEVHVRDFSNMLASSRYPGKYLAFTESGLTNSSGEPAGLDYLTDLGITHVHLQPVYDYATVDEASDAPQFNWGYDPKNYNVPEGSYSTDPWHGDVRIREFKQMVQALHSKGLGVVMDVVYNQTYAEDSCLNRIVPYYYYRLAADGTWSNGSGCGNETASDRVMFRKYMVDSVSYWAEEYHVDGFRFDLMALHDVETMQEIEKAVHAVNPHALLYGEGWTGGTTPLRESLRATQANIRKIEASEGAAGGVAVFNDATRDGLKGSVFNVKEQGYISGNASAANAQNVVFGLTGGEKNKLISWYVKRHEVVNYMACHDNHTLFDRLLASAGESSPESRLQMNRFGTGIIMISQGIPFFLAGEELLRTKNGDGNSYASSDEVNNIRWDVLVPGSGEMAMRDYYRALISLRKKNDFICHGEVTCEVLDDNRILVQYTQNGSLAALALINPNPGPAKLELPEGEWQLLMHAEKVDADGAETVTGAVETPGRTVTLVRRK